jgi:rod shape-determining protein MreC
VLKKRYTISAVFILLIVTLLVYQKINGKSRIIDVFTYPINFLGQHISGVIRETEDILQAYVMLSGKELNNRRLRESIKRLEEKKDIYLESELENRRLRELLGLKSERPDFVTSAEVFARDPGRWFQILWINKGSDDGLEKDMVAVTPSGVVGRVHRVLGGSSSVILVTDVNSSLAVRLQSSRAEGILEGQGGTSCFLKYIPAEVEVAVGDRVISSGLDGIFPEGLMLGYVTDVKSGEGGMFQVIEVEPSQELNGLEEVALLKR